MTTLSRRHLVATLAGAGLVLGTSRAAFAFSDDTPTLRVRALHDNACGATASHQQLVDEVNKTLGEGVSAEDKKAIIANLTCPVCGCPLGGLF